MLWATQQSKTDELWMTGEVPPPPGNEAQETSCLKGWKSGPGWLGIRRRVCSDSKEFCKCRLFIWQGPSLPFHSKDQLWDPGCSWCHIAAQSLKACGGQAPQEPLCEMDSYRSQLPGLYLSRSGICVWWIPRPLRAGETPRFHTILYVCVHVCVF